MKAKTAIFAGLLAALTAGCGERDVILTGERSEIREGMAPFVNQVAPVNDAVPRVNAAWSQRNGGPDHKIAHPALAANLTQVLAVNIGEGDSRRARITAEPVVAGGVIYTLDARARVTATATSGAPVWAVDVTPGRDRATDASGGGVSVAGGRVFVTTGFGELTALDAATGRALWTQDLDAPGTSAPTILGDLVYVVARNSAAWALDVTTGRTQWQINGIPSARGAGQRLCQASVTGKPRPWSAIFRLIPSFQEIVLMSATLVDNWWPLIWPTESGYGQPVKAQWGRSGLRVTRCFWSMTSMSWSA